MRSILLLLVLLLGNARAFGDDRFFILVKQEQKARNRWSLSEWLSQRDRMRLMDLWLTVHSPSPYEFFIGGRYESGHFSTSGYYGGWEIYGAAYASVFGLEGRHDFTNLSQRTSGIFDLRLLGFHAQATNLTLQAGVKNESRGSASLWNPLLGAYLTFYLTRFFGVEGLYRHFFASTSNGVRVSGDRYEGGAFVDFQFVRIFVDYFNEQETSADALSRNGFTLGTKIFF